MPHTLNDQEILAFLVEAPRTGQVATVRGDGRPHVATVWFTVDGGDIVFATASTSVKGKNLERTGFAAFSVDDSNPPFSFATLEGPVSIEDDMEQVRRWARDIAARYMGADWAREYIQMDGFPDDIVCRLSPSHMTGQTALAEG